MISLVILWHMHQPEYASPGTGEYALPWTRLHAVKDYEDMAEVLAAHPEIRTTVNLTPVLCDQIESLAGGNMDLYWQMSEKPAAYLSATEREFILSNFFKANFETMIRPNERYAELLFDRGRSATSADIREAATNFSAQKIRDLQVWANLAWSGEFLRRTDPVVKTLLAKGRQYTEEEKAELLQVHRRCLSRVLDKYKKLQADGIIEVSTTPYYHPILPLLLDMTDAQLAHPNRPLPVNTQPLTEDARWHVETALSDLERRMGRRPTGMWPAEGSVSEKACALLTSCGVTWAATDELILKKSLALSGRGADNGYLNRVYRLDTEGGPLNLFFRDHELSDKIGFVYASKACDAAARHFVEDVKRRAKGSDRVVRLILEGLNAWEYYRGCSCWPFLTEVFTALEKDGDISTRTCGSCTAEGPEAAPLPRLSPGSWINGNFNIWIGHPEDNAGWDALQKVRSAYERMPAGVAKDRAAKFLRVAEGSDWYWWFGDDHSSQDDAMFDGLFRENLSVVCKLAGVPAPPELREAIKKTHATVPAKLPTAAFTPDLDGAIRPFYEWLGAGRFDVNFISGAMHRAAYHVERFYWGFDAEHLYICIESAEAPAGSIFRIHIRTARGDLEAAIPTDAPGKSTLTGPDGAAVLRAAAAEVIEVAIPLRELGLSARDSFSVSLALEHDETEIERWPTGPNLELFVPDEAFFSEQWVV